MERDKVGLNSRVRERKKESQEKRAVNTIDKGAMGDDGIAKEKKKGGEGRDSQVRKGREIFLR